MTYRRSKKLAVLLIAILCLTMFVVVVTFNKASTNEIQADVVSGEAATLRYETYDLTKVLAYTEEVNFADAYLLYDDDDTAWKGEYTGNKKKYNIEVGDTGIDPYTYYGNRLPAQITEYQSIMEKIDAGSYSEGAEVIAPVQKKSQFATDDYMLIKVYAQASNGITSMEVRLNPKTSGDNALSLTDATTAQSAHYPTESGYENTIYAYTNLELFDLEEQPSQSGGIAYLLGDVPSSAIKTGGYTEEVYVGCVAFKVGENPVAGPISCYKKNDPTGTFIGTSNIGISDIANITETYPDNDGIITIKESDSTKAQLDTDRLKINNDVPSLTVDSTSSASIEIDGTHLTTIIAKEQSNDSSTAIALDLYASFGGSIKDNTIKYCIGDPSGLNGGAGTTASVSSNKANIPSSSLSDWDAGESVYVLVTVEAKTGSPKATTSYVIEVPKKKYEDNELISLAVSGGTVCKLCSNGTSTETTFNPSTNAYTLRVSRDATALTLTPNYDDAKFMTVTIAGDEVAKNTAKSIPVTAGSTSSVSIVVTSQKGVANTYTLNIYWLKDTVTLSDITVSVDPTSGPVSHMSAMTPSGTDKYILKGKNYVPYGSAFFQFTATVTSGSGATVKYSTDNSTFGTTTSDRQVTFSTGGTWPEETKEGYIEVTAEDGFTKKVYTLEVTRYGGDTDSELKSSKTFYRLRSGAASYEPSSVQISDGKISATGTQTETTKEYTVEAISDIAFAKKGVGIWATRKTNTSKMTYKYKVGDGDWSSYVEMTDGTPTGDMNFVSTDAAETIYVDLLCTAQDTNYTSLYHFTFNRKAASDDVALASGYPKLYNQASAEIELKQNSAIEFETKNDIDWTTTSVSIKAKFNSLASASATDEVNTYNNLTNDGMSGGFSFSTTTYNAEQKIITLTVTAENGSHEDYTIIVNRAAADNTFTYDLLVETDKFVEIMSVSGVSPQAHVILRDFPYTENEFYVTITPTKSTTKVRFIEKDSTRTLVTGRKKITIDPTGTLDSEIHGSIEFELETQATNKSSPNVSISYTRVQGKSDTTFTYEVQGASGVHSAYSATPSADGRTFTVESYPTKTETSKYWLQIIPTDDSVKIYTTTSTVTSATDSHLVAYSGIAGSKQFDVDTVLYVVIVPEVTYKYKVYAFNVKGQDYRSTENGISNITFSGLPTGVNFIFNEETTTYGTSSSAAFEVPYSANISCTVYVKDTKEGLAKFGLNGTSTVTMIGAPSYTGNITLLEDTINLISIKAKAENGSEGTEYKIYIKRAAGNTEYLLKTLSIDGVNVTFTGTSIDYCTYRGNPQSTIDFTVSTNAYCQIYDPDEEEYKYNTLSYDKNLQESKANTIKIKVISEKQYVDNGVSGTARTYTIRIYSADQNFSISDIKLFNDNAKEHTLIANESYAFNKDVTEYVLTGTYTNFPGVIAVVDKAGNSQNAVVSGDITYVTLTANVQKVLTITIKSEYASLNSNVSDQQATYTFKLTRANPYTVNTLADLWVDVDGTRFDFTPAFSPTKDGDYTLENIDGHEVTLCYEQHSGARQTIDDSSNLSTTLTDPSTIEKLTIKVVPESGTPRTYVVKVSAGQITLSKDNVINQLFVSDTTSNKVSFNKTTHEYLVEVNYPVETVSAYAVLNASTAKLFIYKDGDAEQEYASGEHVDNIEINRNVTDGAETILWIVAKAQDTSVPDNTYKVVIRSAPGDNDTTLKIFTVNGTSITTNGQVINLTYDKNEFTLKAETNSTKSTITPSNVGYKTKYDLNDEPIAPGERLVTFTVTAESGDAETYSVKIVRDDVTTLNDLFISVKDKTPKTNLISFTTDGIKTFNAIDELLYSEKEVVVEYTLTTENPGNVKVTGAGVVSLKEGDNEVKIKIEAASGASTTYTANIKRKAGETGNLIIQYTPEVGDPFGPTGNSITYVLPRGMVGLGFNPTYTVSKNATDRIVEDDIVLHLGLNTFHIEVTSEVGVANMYTVYVYVCETAKDFRIDLMEADNTTVPFQGFTFSEETLTYEFNVAYSIKSAYLKVTRANDSKNATVYVNGTAFSDSVVPLVPGENVFDIYAISEYGSMNTKAEGTKSSTYRITITQETPNTVATLKTLTAVTTGGNLIENFDPSVRTYTINNVQESEIIITAEATVGHPKAIVQNGDKTSSLGNNIVVYTKPLQGTTDEENYNFEHIITVTPEDGAPVVYTIQISRGTVNLQDDNTILDLKLVDSNAKNHISSFSKTTQTYYVDIPYGPQSYTITASKYSGSRATITGEGYFAIDFSKASNLNADGDYYKVHTVYATSQNNEKGTEYTIYVTVRKPSQVATLSMLYVYNSPVDGFTPSKTTYTFESVSNSMDYIIIDATPTDASASVTGQTGYQVLKEGQNTFVVTVTAQSGAQQNYYIYIKRQYRTPELRDLDVVGETLLNATTGIAITDFERDTKNVTPHVQSFKVKVKYVTEVVTIKALVEESSYTVYCSNATFNTSISTSTSRAYNANLIVGKNTFTIRVQSTQGEINTYLLEIERRDIESANTNISKLSIKADGTNEIIMDDSEYNSAVSVYEYTVPNSVRSLDCDIVPEKMADEFGGEGAEVTVFNAENLNVGLNRVVVLVTAEDGETTRAVVINVIREDVDYSVAISAENNTINEGEKTVSKFTTDFDPADDKKLYTYEVSNAVTSLNFTAKNKDANGVDPTISVVEGQNLKVGDNAVKIVIKQDDGTSIERTVNVKRLPMSYTVNKNAYEYACSETQGTAGKNYTISLGSKSFDAIDDYTKYIEFDASQMLTTEVISQSNSEVVVKVASVDNAEIEYVHFQIDSTANRGTTFDILFWIILGLAVVLLVIILIFVNKDKYGAVSNSRKK